MCGLSFLYYCSLKRISLFLFFEVLKSWFLTLWWEFFFLLAENQTVVCIMFFFWFVYDVSFVNCILFIMMNTSCLPFFCNQVFFFVYLFVLVFLFSTCKLYILRYTEDEILFRLPEVEVLDRTQGLFSWSQGSKWNCRIRWASVSWWKCDLLL